MCQWCNIMQQTAVQKGKIMKMMHQLSSELVIRDALMEVFLAD